MEGYQVLSQGVSQADNTEASKRRMFEVTGDVVMIILLVAITILVTIGIVVTFVDIKGVDRMQMVSIFMYIIAALMLIMFISLFVFKMEVYNKTQLTMIGLAMVVNLVGGIYISNQKRPLKADILKGIVAGWGVVTVVAALTPISLVGKYERKGYYYNNWYRS
jgi:predicted membrane channel-forming protein YqfA (hemolysin III family)